MGSIVALDAFRASVEKTRNTPQGPPRPDISGADVWTRDYREVEAVVFGLLTVRNLAAHHRKGYDPALDSLCMDGLDAAYTVDTVGPARLKAALKPLKEWLLDAMTEDNKRDMSWALVIIDLIEKSPARARS
ncbi:hypothetical protein GKC30_13165 [Pseudodesulfovibrio sp. F-1]|uniref:Uncharacterized protein n=1 Tax=Pseudodesulfovibrio alkaliphilus TaxID=2661613 RepID=A0A7K1KR58_9BACT|nr:hypothetical protein [Pseudodesulfovibrio alkaliphilus]MUM78586.1 hypothetical protein [Pseudodesulfovibrio alkaliphilus]